MSKIKILVVDDDSVILEMIKKIASEEMSVKCVLSLSQAKRALNSKFDLIVTDHYLSETETASDLLDYIKEHKIKIPLALMTGKPAKDIPPDLKKRAVKIFKKPFPIKNLAKWASSKIKAK